MTDDKELIAEIGERPPKPKGQGDVFLSYWPAVAEWEQKRAEYYRKDRDEYKKLWEERDTIP